MIPGLVVNELQEDALENEAVIEGGTTAEVEGKRGWRRSHWGSEINIDISFQQEIEKGLFNKKT